MDIETQSKEATAIFKDTNAPIALKFVEVVYKINLPKKGFYFFRRYSRSEEKVILNNISGAVEPGEVLAMLGPSGSGKTTLLTALGGRLGGRLHGSITYNGKPFSKDINSNTGFVNQDDVLYPHLTVTETLVYTALLRLPNSFSKEEKIMQAEAVITRLGLIKCKNSMIGNQFLRGISGGERKRVSIGQEILINPSLLLLDEPTSGLDSTTAQRIVSILLEFAQGRRTVVLTIHQPSSRLFYMFQKVLLLSEGNPLYFGQGWAAMDYFSSIGFAPSFVAMNPSDFLLDLANGVSSNESREDNQAAVKKTLISAYKSNIDEKLKDEIKETGYRSPGELEKKFSRWATTWWQQFTVLLQRGVRERKFQSFTGPSIAQVLVVAVITGLLWWQSDTAQLQDQVGVLFFSSVFWVLFPLLQAIFTFPQERTMLEKERSSGVYRLSSYFMSKIIADLPMELILPTVFITITYWMAGLKPSAGNFAYALCALLLSVLVSQGLGLAVGVLLLDPKSASIFGLTIMQLSFLSGGFYVQHVPPFIEWIKYLSINYHTYKLLLGSQYMPNETYPCGDPGKVCLVKDFPSIKGVGLDGQVFSAFALAIMLVLYRLIAYLALMRIGVTKKLED